MVVNSQVLVLNQFWIIISLASYKEQTPIDLVSFSAYQDKEYTLLCIILDTVVQI